MNFDQVTEEDLVELKDRSSQGTLVIAAKRRKFEAIIETGKNMGETNIPAVKYHRKRR